jgi:hypothetical protein
LTPFAYVLVYTYRIPATDVVHHHPPIIIVIIVIIRYTGYVYIISNESNILCSIWSTISLHRYEIRSLFTRPYRKSDRNMNYGMTQKIIFALVIASMNSSLWAARINPPFQQFRVGNSAFDLEGRTLSFTPNEKFESYSYCTEKHGGCVRECYCYCCISWFESPSIFVCTIDDFASFYLLSSSVGIISISQQKHIKYNSKSSAGSHIISNAQ